MKPITLLQHRGPTDPATEVFETRVAWIAPSLDRGWRWQAFLKEFSAVCPKTVVFTGQWPGFTPGFEGAFNIHPLKGFRRVNLRESQMGYPNGFMWVSPRALLDLLHFHPDVILSNGFHLCTLYALLVKAISGARLILLWQGVSPETGGGKGSLRLKLRQFLSRYFDLAICNTQSGVDYLQRLVGMPREKVVRFIGEVADRSSFPSLNGRRKFEAPPKRPRFLFVGRIIRAKGVDRLLQACALLAKDGITEFSVVLVGKGPHQDEFVELAYKCGVADYVRWEGFVPYERLGAYYEACDVFVLPSLEDTWGVVALEAMAFGKPVLCSCFAGSSELVEHGVSGFVFDPDKPEELAEYMRSFIECPQLITRQGTAAKATMERFTPRRAAATLAQIIHQTLKAEAVVETCDFDAHDA